MEPSLPKGSVILTTPEDPGDIGVGNIIAFRQPDDSSRVISHRVIDVIRVDSGIEFKTKGDANNSPDPWTVRPGNLVGIVWLHVPWLGYFVAWATSGFGYTALVLLPCALVILNELRVVYRFIRYGREAFE